MCAHRQTLNEPIVVFAPDRPALALLIKAMERRLSQRQGTEIAPWPQGEGGQAAVGTPPDAGRHRRDPPPDTAGGRMNAPVRTDTLGDIDDFVECCEQQAWFYAEDWVSLQTAVDNLQYLAERWHLVALYGQDAIQTIIAFSAAPAELPSDDERHLVRDWELADPRDRWRHDGSPRPSDDFRNSDIGIPTAAADRSYKPVKSTIDAFQFLITAGDVARIKGWLADRSKDAPYLLSLLED